MVSLSSADMHFGAISLTVNPLDGGGGDNRLLKFLLRYWVVCLFFLMVGMPTDAQFPGLDTFGANLVGLKTGVHDYINYINVHFAWYVAFYICFVVLSPLLIKIFRISSRPYVDLIFLGVILAIFDAMTYGGSENLVRIIEIIYPFISIFLGIIMAKYDILTI